MAWRWCFQVNGAGLTRGYTWLNLKMYWIISGLYLQTPWKKKWKWGLNEPWPLTAIWGSWCRQRETLHFTAGQRNRLNSDYLQLWVQTQVPLASSTHTQTSHHSSIYLSLSAELHVFHPLTVALELGQGLPLHPLVEFHWLLQRLDPLLQVHLIADLALVLWQTFKVQWSARYHPNLAF